MTILTFFCSHRAFDHYLSLLLQQIIQLAAAMEEAFVALMEKFVTPITVLVGLLGNVLSICVLRKKEIQVPTDQSNNTVPSRVP
jgi:hypothetical protein